MTFSITKHKHELLFVPLGGAGEIGMNMNLYQLDGKWLMVDFGAGFAEDFLPGVDMILPDIQFIEQYKKDLLGLVLTHAHEDHLGAIVHLWDQFDCPIYTTPFTAAFLKHKLVENGVRDIAKIVEIEMNGQFELGPFRLELLQITHSVPEMHAVVIHTKYGKIFHSGDWKLDPKPMVGEATDEARIKALGDEGILAFVGDSTNVFSPGHSGSEGELRKSLIDIVGGCKKMVVVATFASNVARIESIIRAAEACGRRVVIAGRSIWRIIHAAQESGYLNDLKYPLLEDQQIGKVAKNKLLVLATGCQGEPLAAMNKIAQGTHRTIHLTPGDTVIFSSKIIPGNEKRIFRLFNQLSHLGAEVKTEKNSFVHVSGHPNRDELKRMYELVRPHIAIPVHGEQVHMEEHAKLAKSWGVKEVVHVNNGDVVRLAPNVPEKLAKVPNGILAIDGNFLLAPDSSIMKMRRKLQREGIIMITLILSRRGLAMDPIIMAPGVLDHHEDKDIIAAIEEEVVDALEDSLFGRKKVSQDRLEQVIRSAVRRIVRKEVNKNPPIEIVMREMKGKGHE